jgi:hypothetical protein
MSTCKTVAVWVLVLGLTASSYVFFDAARARRNAAENAAKEAAWLTRMEAKMEKLRP